MIFLECIGSRASLSATVNGCIPEECGFFLCIRRQLYSLCFPRRKCAYTGDVSAPIGLVVRSGGGKRAYMGEVGTPILKKCIFHINIME